MKVTSKEIEATCKECAFYNDCPIDYLCPPAEIIKFLHKEAKKGRVKILFRGDLKEELEEE